MSALSLHRHTNHHFRDPFVIRPDGALRWCSLRDFAGLLADYIAAGAHSEEQDIYNQFKIGNDGAFRIQHGGDDTTLMEAT